MCHICSTAVWREAVKLKSWITDTHLTPKSRADFKLRYAHKVSELVIKVMGTKLGVCRHPITFILQLPGPLIRFAFVTRLGEGEANVPEHVRRLYYADTRTNSDSHGVLNSLCYELIGWHRTLGTGWVALHPGLSREMAGFVITLLDLLDPIPPEFAFTTEDDAERREQREAARSYFEAYL